ncbi:complement decay-accelerating factor, GPI-anchored isoform X2 [Plectropomus leopardus]|uniref:complement decay-accelerating factor, GPI-anchored isoform X2 n=1 Tax=Plectropomus leopardus TaxID=160734 RepID=UPI001C4BCCF7|nr:complement decay-accelerating factor, GPI-anchored isoform X2 [Plectropomus leopardus]
MDVSVDTCGQRGVKCLLLLHLFVLKAAADCPKPQGGENTVLTNDALLMNNFLEGSDVTLECTNGYTKDSGSGVITCVDDKWTEPDLICKRKDCGRPNPQPHMSFNISAGTLFGDSIKVICAKGYRIAGVSYKRCFATGWSGRSTCEIVTCDIPGKVTNGRSTWDSQDEPKYGETIQYICDDGYTLIGKDTIMCSETGLYDSQPPECKEVYTFTDPSATSTAHRDTSLASSSTPTVSPSLQGGREILTAEGEAATTSVASVTSPFQDMHDGTVDTNKDTGYLPVIVSVICVSLEKGLCKWNCLLRSICDRGGTGQKSVAVSLSQWGKKITHFNFIALQMANNQICKKYLNLIQHQLMVSTFCNFFFIATLFSQL